MRNAGRRSGRAVAALGAVLSIAIVGCAGPQSNAEPASTTPPTTTLVTTTTARATTSTTTSTSSTTTSTTTTSTTTLPRQVSLPVAAPLDVKAPENNPPLGRIAIPSIGLESELEEGIRLTTLNRGPGHWPGSAMPGEIGNVVVAGHRTSHGAEFRHLDRLVPGDEVVFTTATGAHRYLVTGTQIVTPDALWITDPTDAPTATLFACHPLGSTAKRIVVSLALAS